jgi:hypothetical protein
MAYSPQEKAEIVAQVAAKVAGSICCGNPDPNVYLATVETVHNDLMERIAAATAAAGATIVTQVFPGATVSGSTALVAPAPTPAPAPAPVPTPAPQVQGGPITHASSEDAKWADALVANPGNWHNNIGDKKSEAGPDFRHRTIKDVDGKWNIGLWIKSERFSTRAPDWVFQQLNMDIPAGYSAS